MGDQVPPGLSVETAELRTYYGGAARLAATINALRAEAAAAGEDVVTVHAGDGITGTLYYTLLGTDPDAAVMNALQFDAFVPGNHEFDDGDTNFADFVRKLNIPVTSRNCEYSYCTVLLQYTGTNGIVWYLCDEK